MPEWTPEEARKHAVVGALKSAEVRRANRDIPALIVKKALPNAMRDLVSASKGEDPWGALPLRDRLTALLKVIEYGMGRPIGVDKQGSNGVKSEGNGTEPEGGLSFE